MISYKTVRKIGSAEQSIERSRFIAYAAPAESREEAEAFIAEIKAKHKDATHNVPAMVIGEKMQLQWASDDGEPQGTSGAPIVQMLVKEEITNVAIVVTRYFGGVKLGTGGLVRAYTSSAKLGLAAAGLCAVREMSVLRARLDYSYLAKLQSIAKTQTVGTTGGFEIADIEYAEAVVVKLVSELDTAEAVKEMLANLTGGTAQIISEESELARLPIGEENE